MRIIVYNLPKDLEVCAFRRVIFRFCKTKKYIKICFDHRMTQTYGTYKEIISEKNRHIGHEIKLSLPLCGSGKRKMIKIYQYISTLLHELRHLYQREKFGSKKFSSKEFDCNKNMAYDDFYSLVFSESETDARMYENKYVLPAVEYYNNVCKNVK